MQRTSRVTSRGMGGQGGGWARGRWRPSSRACTCQTHGLRSTKVSIFKVPKRMSAVFEGPGWAGGRRPSSRSCTRMAHARHAAKPGPRCQYSMLRSASLRRLGVRALGRDAARRAVSVRTAALGETCARLAGRAGIAPRGGWRSVPLPGGSGTVVHLVKPRVLQAVELLTAHDQSAQRGVRVGHGRRRGCRRLLGPGPPRLRGPHCPWRRDHKPRLGALGVIPQCRPDTLVIFVI